MTCPDIHKFHLTCWTFEFEITPATRNQTGLGYWLMLHTSFVFSCRCWTPKTYGRGQSPSLTHGCGMASHSWECSIHCISYVKTTCDKNCKNDHSWFVPKNFYFEIHCFRMVRNFCFETKTWFAHVRTILVAAWTDESVHAATSTLFSATSIYFNPTIKLEYKNKLFGIGRKGQFRRFGNFFTGATKKLNPTMYAT